MVFYFEDYVRQEHLFNPEKSAYREGAMVSSERTASEEMLRTAVHFGKNSGKRLRHSILAFNENENVTPEQADEYAKRIILHYAPEYQVVYSVHTNTACPHIHFVMNQISYEYKGDLRYVRFST